MTDQPNPAAAPPPADPGAGQPTPTWTEPTLPAVEPAEDAAPAEAVTRASAPPTGTPASRRSIGVRWAIAIGGIAVVIGATAAILILASGRPTPSIAVGYMPENTAQYAEYRLDLPGDQRQKMAAFLSRFPGFADQAAVQPKLYEVFDRIVKAASSTSQTFTTDIEPWFGGQIALGLGPLDASSLAAASTGSPMGQLGNGVLVITIKDAAKANAWILKTVGSHPVATSSSDGATFYTADGMAAAVTDKVLIGGSEAAVKAAVATKGSGNLASDPEFKAAFSAVSRDYVSFSFIDYRSYVSSIVKLAGPAAGLDNTTVDDVLLGLVPAWFEGDMRFEDDALVSQSAFPSINFGFDAKNRASTLAAHAPPSALFYAESHDIGAAQKAFLDKLRAIPELSSTFGQIDQSAGLIGGLDGLFGWWGDTALAVGPAPDGTIGGALLIAPTDAAAARKTFETLRSFAVLGGQQAGIVLRDEKHGDATITTIDFSAAAGAGASDLPAGYKAEIAYSVTDDLVVVGYGASYVGAVLDAGPGPSLADDARFKGLVGRVGAENLGLTFVDIQGIRGLVEPLVKSHVPAEDWTTYETEIVPYLSHLDALVSSARVDGGINRMPLAFTLK